ncbi:MULTISPECIES: ABC transporter substrate-binding protein [Arthrobacter]|uniref:ABC transporter substrate-binding protein n=1 Tax=unclassified Arthrobacter TaxID=235627 RepID=UPI0024BA069B|nr:ABC transporter substrate-binding protein [Arthrobacter sp. H35-MC1]MDJ0318494.1 ABC transporter substrate-binding protein [Arthrobacter sp. H35-MC1]
MNKNSTSTRRGFLGAAAGLSVAFAITACGGGDPLAQNTSSGAAGGGEAVVVGSANFPENAILAEIYAGALSAAGMDATTRLNIGAREVYLKALEDGSIDVVPEYTGNLLGYLDASNTVVDGAGILAALPAKMPAGISVLDASSAEDKDAIVVTAETAAKYKLKSIADLTPVCSELTLAAPSEFQTRPYGLPGLKKLYDCVPKDFKAFSASSEALNLKALLNDEVQFADIFTTSPEITANKLVVLQDPKSMIGAQQVIPIIKTDKVNEAGQKALNNVSKQLTTEDLIALRTQVEGDQKMDPKAAAAQWLKDKGITK